MSGAPINAALVRWAQTVSLAAIPKATPVHRHVLVTLALDADGGAKAAPGLPRICTLTGLSMRPVQLAIKALISAELLSREVNTGQKVAFLLKSGVAALRRTPVAATPPRGGRTPVAAASPPRCSNTPVAATRVDSCAPADEVPSTPLHENGGTGGSRASRERATRLPADWQPTPQDIAYAVDRDLNWQAVAEDFRGYFLAKPGAAGLSLNWTLNWQGWCRREAKWIAERAARGKPAGPAKTRRELQHERIMAMVNGGAEARH